MKHFQASSANNHCSHRGGGRTSPMSSSIFSSDNSMTMSNFDLTSSLFPPMPVQSRTCTDNGPTATIVASMTDPQVQNEAGDFPSNGTSSSSISSSCSSGMQAQNSSSSVQNQNANSYLVHSGININTTIKPQISTTASPTGKKDMDIINTTKEEARSTTNNNEIKTDKSENKKPNATTPTTTRTIIKNLKFPVLLMHLVDGKNELSKYQHVISWVSTNSFSIHNPEQFELEILPKYFNSNGKVGSFERKLYRWGFAKSREHTDRYSFTHEKFIRGDMGSCMQIEFLGSGIDKFGILRGGCKMKPDDSMVTSITTIASSTNSLPLETTHPPSGTQVNEPCDAYEASNHHNNQIATVQTGESNLILNPQGQHFLITPVEVWPYGTCEPRYVTTGGGNVTQHTTTNYSVSEEIFGHSHYTSQNWSEASPAHHQATENFRMPPPPQITEETAVMQATFGYNSGSQMTQVLNNNPTNDYRQYPIQHHERNQMYYNQSIPRGASRLTEQINVNNNLSNQGKSSAILSPMSTEYLFYLRQRNQNINCRVKKK